MYEEIVNNCIQRYDSKNYQGGGRLNSQISGDIDGNGGVRTHPKQRVATNNSSQGNNGKGFPPTNQLLMGNGKNPLNPIQINSDSDILV